MAVGKRGRGESVLSRRPLWFDRLTTNGLAGLTSEGGSETRHYRVLTIVGVALRQAQGGVRVNGLTGLAAAGET